MESPIRSRLPAASLVLLLSRVASAFFGPPVTIPIGEGFARPASVAIGDVDGDGRPDVVTASNASDSVVVLLGSGDGTLRLSAGFPVGKSPIAAVLVDIDRDGKLDIVAANGGDATLSVLLGDGLGGFSQASYSPITLSGTPTALRASDVDADGMQDLLVTTQKPAQVVVIRGASHGFHAPWAFDIPVRPQDLSYAYVTDFVVSDFDLDGRPDVAVTALSKIHVLLGRGDGTFASAPGGTIDLDQDREAAAALSVGDLDSDGRADLAVSINKECDSTCSANVSVFTGNGNGTFTRGQRVSLEGGYFLNGALGDVNGDGKLDLVMRRDTGVFEVQLGDGSGGFSKGGSVPFQSAHAVFGFADLSGDGRTAIVAVSYRRSVDGFVSIFFGDRAGALKEAPGSPVPTASGPLDVAVGDLNHDGRPDLVSVNAGRSPTGGRVTAFLRTESGRFELAPGSPFVISSGAGSIEVVDANGDGDLDLAVGFFILLGDGHGGFSPAPAASSVLPGADQSYSFRRFVDVNGDGKVDLVCGKACSPIRTYLGRGDGSFAPPIPTAIEGPCWDVSLTVGDMNRDGALDLVLLVSKLRQVIMILRGNRTGLFVPHLTIQLPERPWASNLDVADVDADGRPDIIVIRGSLPIQTLFGDVSGNVRLGPVSDVTGPDYGGSVIRRALVDFDGDGALDVVTGLQSWANTNDVTVAFGDRTGRFTGGEPRPLPETPARFADLDGDGLPDAVAVGASGIILYPRAHLGITPTTLRGGTRGAPFQQRLTAEGGSGPYTFKVANGTVPYGLTFEGDGSLSGTPLAVGTYTFTASATDVERMSGSATYTIAVADGVESIVALTSSPNPAAPGQAVSLEVSVSGGAGTPTGSVTFRDGSRALAVVSLAGGQASIALSFTAGSHGLTAEYSGVSPYRSAVSAPLVLVVGSDVLPRLVLTATPNPTTVGTSVVLTARVSTTPNSPAGALTLYDGGEPLGSESVDSSGVARFTVSFQKVGTHFVSVENRGPDASTIASSAAIAMLVRTKGGCDSGGDDVLCLLGERYLATVDSTSAMHQTGAARALADGSGAFSFGDVANLALAVKALDGRSVNDAFWIGYGALSDAAHTIQVVEAATGRTRSYRNASKTLASGLDAYAFPAEEGQVTRTEPALEGCDVEAAPPGCPIDGSTLCLAAQRFQVSVLWRDPQENSNRMGHAVPLAGDTGYFWFLDAGNAELLVKVLDGLPVNSRYWVAYGALSDLEYFVTVTDTVTHKVKTYHNPPGTFQSLIDTEAF